MILLWFVLGILLAFAIARYNESNKLFWQLMLAFVLGYAATVMCTRTFDEEGRSSVNLTQVYPTQVPVIMPNSKIYFLNGMCDVATTKVTASEPVSQDITPVLYKIGIVPSEVFGRTRDQPIVTLTQPPECLTKVFSTHHDTG